MSVLLVGLKVLRLVRAGGARPSADAGAASAKELGCASLHSADLNPGQDYDGVQVRNPFLA